MQKIPFAIKACSGELVEVGRVQSGRDCGCVCPSCGQSVIARKGDVNQWHFAHDNKGTVSPLSLCEISFYVCCKRFVIEQLIKNETLTLSTPAYVVSEKRILSSNRSFKTMTRSMTVTEERLLDVDSFDKEGRFDLAVVIGTHVIDIILSYPGKQVPEISEQTNAVLIIDLEFIANKYDGMSPGPEVIQQAVVELFGTDVVHKRWLFHPRELSVRARLIKKLDEELEAASSNQHLLTKPVVNALNVSCKMCNEEWTWNVDEPMACKKCNTHLFVVSAYPN